jgi:hypothetical protein
MRRFWPRTLLLAVVGVGCTLGGPGLIPVTDFTKRHECQGFSVLPPKVKTGLLVHFL